MADVETDGPIPGDFSMISFGLVKVDHQLKTTFYGKLKPISDKWDPEALSISGFSREETLLFDDPKKVMEDCEAWILSNVGEKKRPYFIADNNGFDWMNICWYFNHFLGRCPFGYSSTNLGSLYKGFVKDTTKNFKHLRKTKHDHNPVNDAIGNAEALLEMRKMGLWFPI